jgi:peptidylprolyl isomerase
LAVPFVCALEGSTALTRRASPQRKRRQKQFDPLRAAGGYHPPARHGFWHRIFHNRWIVVGGMAVIAIGTILGSLCSAAIGDPSQTSSVRNQAIRETATPEAAPTPTSDPNASPTPTPAPTPTPIPRSFNAPPAMAIDPDKQYFATIRTDRGDIRVELLPKEAPQAVNNFVFLARNDFYDGLTFHRVIPGFVAQGGDPTGGGAGGPGYNLPEEKNSLTHDTGVIAMAKAGPTTSGSQFYITLAPQPGLDGTFTPFGRVVSGLNVLQQIAPRDPARNPRAAPGDKILSIDIEER